MLPRKDENINHELVDRDFDPKIVAQKDFYLWAMKILYENNGKVLGFPVIASFFLVFLPSFVDSLRVFYIDLGVDFFWKIISDFYFIMFFNVYYAFCNMVFNTYLSNKVPYLGGFFYIAENILYPFNKNERFIFNLIIIKRLNIAIYFSIVPFGILALCVNSYSGV